jgi:hypothetical protein
MTLKSQFLVAAFLVFAQLSSIQAQARNHHNGDNRGGGQQQDQTNNQDQGAQAQAGNGDTSSDAAIVAAVNGHQRLNFVEGGNMVVTKILPDDTQGLQHQKWMVRLSNGQQLMAVYNSDMCPRVPVKVGDVVAMGGQFIWTSDGGLLHWLHKDPRHSRPDGYVEIDGKFYCKD